MRAVDGAGRGGAPSPPPPHTLRSRVACWFYAARGRCSFGAACRYSHDVSARAGAAVPGTAGREWVRASVAPPAPETTALSFRVLSYNTLADVLAFKHAPELYRAVPPGVLPWRARVAGLRAELAHHSADIVCLQEIDRAADVAGFLRAAGYDTAYAPRTGGRADGCLTAWRRGRFVLAGPPQTLAMADHGLKDNVALVVGLKPVGPSASEGAPTLVVANTHLLFNPKRGDVKLGQARTLLHAMHAAATDWRATHALLMGDFNATPGSAVYEFVARGALALGDHDRRALSGQLVGSGAVAAAVAAATAPPAPASGAQATRGEDVDTDDEFAGGSPTAHPPPPPSPPPAYYDPMLLDSSRSRGSSSTTTSNNNSWTLDQLHAAAGAPAAPPPSARVAGAPIAAGWVASHPLRLASAYAATAGVEPPFTSAHSRFIGTVDYVWFTPEGVVGGGGAATTTARLHPTRVLAPPPLASLPGGLPSPDYPSDHVSVIVDFCVGTPGPF